MASTFNTSGRLAPKPQRDIHFWLSYDCLIKAGLNKDGMQVMDEKGQVTCRQCLGFAHSIKNCSTVRRIENFKQFNQLAKTFFAQFQRKQIDRDLDDWETKITDEEVIETWPVKTALQEFLTSKKTIAARKKFDMVDSDAHSLSLFV